MGKVSGQSLFFVLLLAPFFNSPVQAACVVNSVMITQTGDGYQVTVNGNGCTGIAGAGAVLPPLSGSGSRAYYDLGPARLETGVTPEGLPVGVTARLSQFSKDKVRIALDLSTSGWRVVGETAPVCGFRILPAAAVPVGPANSYYRDYLPTQLTKLPLGCKKPLAVIDAGHGGKDPGALGSSGLKEKDINLDVASQVARLLKSVGVEVLLTRSNDVFVELRERAAFANRKRADMFISIHANASLNKNTTGVETYHLGFLSPALGDRFNQELASVEERAALLESVLNTLLSSDRVNDSALLAGAIQQRLGGELRRQFPASGRDLGVKQAPFAVLAQTRVPAALVETGFLTNSAESSLLAGAEYRRAAAQGIAAGIVDYYVSTQCESSSHLR